MAGKKIIMRTGEALVEADDAWSAAEPEVVIGELDGPVGYAIANLIGDQVKGHTRVWAILNSDVQVRPAVPDPVDVRSRDVGQGLDVPRHVGAQHAELRRPAGADAVSFGGGADGNEDQVRCGDGLTDIGGKVEIAAAGGGYHLIESWFVNRQGGGVPRVNALDIKVRHIHLDVRTFRGDERHGRSADIASSEATDGFDR